MSIALPPLPAPLCWLANDTRELLRARDLEVAKCVLEAAAKVCGKAASAANIAWCISGKSEDFDLSCALAKIEAEIRDLKVSHE